MDFALPAEIQTKLDERDAFIVRRVAGLLFGRRARR